MKHILLMALLLSLGLLCGSTWQTITNVDHVYDYLEAGGYGYLATWGGIVKLPDGLFSNGSSEQISYLNTGNGLISNDIRTLAYIDFSHSLWMGSSELGISIQSAQGFQELNSTLGLPSNSVSKIVSNQSTILVGTSAGLALFYYLEGVSFPLMLHQYTFENTSGGLMGNNIKDMLLAANKRLYLATNAGISYVHIDSLDVDSAWHSLHYSGSPLPIGGSFSLSANATHLAVSVDNRVFVHALDLSQGSWQIYNSQNGLSGQSISSVLLDEGGKLWVAYGSWNENLLSWINNSNILLTSLDSSGTPTQFFKNTLGLGYSPISKITTSGQLVLLCSWGQGVYLGDGSSWSNWVPNNIGFGKISQIVTDNSYDPWFASGYYDNDPVRKGTMGTSRLHNGTWTTYNIANSPIHSDNIVGVAVDPMNRKWFATWDNSGSPAGWDKGISIYDEANNLWRHITDEGIRTYDNETQSWSAYDPSTSLTTGTIGGIYPGADNTMLVMCYDGGVDVLNTDLQIVGRFNLYNSVYQRGLYATYSGGKYFFGTNNDRGLVIWNRHSMPETGGLHWLVPSPPELSNCIVYGVVSVDTPYEGMQHWIAASTGLFMWNEDKWYRYDTMIKRFVFNTSTYQWNNETLYYENEERLFGSVRTTPTSILLDPFNRIWIGSMENGISMYNPETERFTNYYKPSQPLLSNYITSLGYDPVQGNLLIGTPDGLNTLKIGRIVKPDTELNSVKAFPNPFRPAVHGSVQIVNLPEDSMPAGTGKCNIYDAAGMLVAKLTENAFSRFEWNGRSSSGKDCASGVYFFVVADEKGNTKKGKLVLLR